MRTHSLLPLLLLSCPLTLGSGPTRSQDEHLLSTYEQYVLRVVDFENEAPIVGALAWGSYTLGEEHFPLADTTTNVHGEAAFDLSEIRELRHIEQLSVELEIHVASPGYTTGDYWGDACNYDWDETLAERDWCSLLMLEAGRSVIGRVVDDRGAPLHDAKITAGVWDQQATDWSGEERGYFAWTDATGRFSLELGNHPIRDLFASHHRAGHASMQIAPGGLDGLPRGGIEVALERSALFLRGTFLGPSGESLGRPKISVEHAQASPYALDYDVPVAEDGSFEVACPHGGPWTIGSYEYGDLPDAVPGQGTAHLHVPRFHVVVHVVDEDGVPVRSGSPRFHALRQTSAGLRPDYSGESGDEQTHMRSSGEYGSSSGGGVWTCPLRRAGGCSVSLSFYDWDGVWLAEDTVLVDEANPVVHHTLVLRKVQPAGPIEITFVDEHDQPLREWSGSLHSLLTGLKTDQFTEKGTPQISCMAPSFSELSWLAGDYRLRLGPARGQYALPVEAEIAVHADVTNRFRLQSPGTGGRLIAATAKRHAGQPEWATIELTRTDGDRTVECLDLYRGRRTSNIKWARMSGAYFGAPSRLLEPGTWNWRVLSDGALIGEGTVRIRAGEDTKIELDFGG